MMKIKWSVTCVIVFLLAVVGEELTEKEYSYFPRLYHLDDLETCMARDGLYCLGAFHLEPLASDNSLYQKMLEYSKDPLRYNRTVIHRGYCVSSRCGHLNKDGVSDAQLFQRCVDLRARTHSFKATPLTVQYCNRRQDFSEEIEWDVSQISFIILVGCIILFNVVGTVHDLRSDEKKKKPYLVAWSCASNWKQMTNSCHADVMPVQGVRVIILLLVMWLHCGLIHFMAYSHEPRYLEEMLKQPFVMLVRNGTSLVQVFVVLSSFLSARRLLQGARDQPLHPRALPYCICMRLARIVPVYMVVVWFAASWWGRLGRGPLWAPLVGAEAAVCRRKWWTHLLFINNFVQPDDHCLIQTWFLAVDMQLFVASCVLTLALSRCRRPLLVLVALFFGFSCLNGVLAYFRHWKTMLYIMNPENLRTKYRGEASFSEYYQAPWGSLPAAVFGMFLAYLYDYQQEKKFHFRNHKWLVCLYQVSLLLLLGFVMLGLVSQHYTSRLFCAVYVAIERPVFSALCGACFFGMISGVDSVWRRVFGWRGWVPLARASLGALALHWPVALSARARHPRPPPATHEHAIWDWTATATLTYLAAIPLTVFIEMPAQKFIGAVLASTITSKGPKAAVKR